MIDKDLCLDEALKKLGKKDDIPVVYDKFSGHESSLEDYYNKFIKDRLLDKESVKYWHKFLLDYTNQDGSTMFLRCANTDKNLKRGWMTRYKCGERFFNVIFTDNDLAMTIYKLVLEGYSPDTKEKQEDLKSHLTSFKKREDLQWYSAKKKLRGEQRGFLDFPVHFQNTRELEHEKNAAVISGPNCCLGRYGYKHSHIFDAGKNYNIENKQIGMAEINSNYITIGDKNDYQYDKCIENYVRVIDLSKDEERYKLLKMIARASTLRFLSPINYFLSPQSQNNIYSFNGTYSNDSAEFDVLLSFLLSKVEQYFDDETKHAMLISDDKYFKELKAKYEKSTGEFEIMYFGGTK